MDLPAEIGTGEIEPETLGGAHSKIPSQPLGQLTLCKFLIHHMVIFCSKLLQLYEERIGKCFAIGRIVILPCVLLLQVISGRFHFRTIEKN